MTTKVGIWIDHRKAVIVTVTADRIITKTVPSQIGRHTRYGGARDSGGEQQYEERFGHRLDEFFDTVVGEIGHPEALLVLGPGEAKHQFTARLAHSRAMTAADVDVETADKLTESQIVAKVKTHFGLGIVRLGS